jgi:hypothetical protein
MIWVLGLVVLAFVLPRLIRQRREIVAIFPWQPISTLHSAWSRRTSKERKAALDAATSLLR